MSNEMSLKELAATAAAEELSTNPTPVAEEVNPVPTPTEEGNMYNTSMPATGEDTDDAAIIADRPAFITPTPVEAINTENTTPVPVGITMGTGMLDATQPPNMMANTQIPSPDATVEASLDDERKKIIEELWPDLEEKVRIERAAPITAELPEYYRNLIINEGLSPEEAKTASDSYFRKKLTDSYVEYKKANPDTGSIIISKTSDENELGMTVEEHKKLERVKKIRLVVVEDKELANITIERPKEEHKADYVKNIDGSMSKYSVPLPMYGDFVNFRGAQIIQMVNIVNYEDARVEEILNKKSSLIYDKIINGSILRKFDENGVSKLSYTEFVNNFPYQDVDIALYGILCASSMEEVSTSLTCEACDHTWTQKYNTKSLLKLDNISDNFKARVDSILANKSNDIALKVLVDDMKKAKRYKSPFSGNIFDLSYPTIGRATNIFKRINQEDSVMTYISAIAIYLSGIMVYNSAKNSYIEVTAEETNLMLDTLLSLSNEDMDMLSTQIREDLFYSAEFELSVQCPSCKKKSTLPLSIENLIFLKAQDSMVEIDK